MPEAETQDQDDAEQKTQATSSNSQQQDDDKAAESAYAGPSVDEIVTATKAALEEAGLTGRGDDGDSKVDVDKLLEKQRGEIAAAISGEKPKKELDPILQSLFTDPQNTLAVLSETIEGRISEKYEAERSQERAEAQAGVQLRKDRPDIATSESNASLVARLYAMTDPNATPDARMKEAVTEFDKILEAAGAGTSDERKAQATSMSSAGASTSGTEGDSGTESDEKLAEEELVARQERFRKVRNIH